MAELVWYPIKMTSNTLPIPLVASASSFYGAGADPYKAFNGTLANASDCWVSGNGQPVSWLQLDFGVKTKVDSFKISARNHNAADPLKGHPKTFDFLGSDDGVNFELILAVQNQTSWTYTDVRQYPIGRSVNYRYYRLSIKENNGNTAYSTLGLLSFGYFDVKDKILIKKYDGVYVYYDSVDSTFKPLGAAPTDADWLNKGLDNKLTLSQQIQLAAQGIKGKIALRRL